MGRILMVASIAMFLAAAVAIGPGRTNGHAANYIGDAYMDSGAATCYIQANGARTVGVQSPRVQAYDNPQLVYWWVRLVDASSGAPLTSWTLGSYMLVNPGLLTFQQGQVVIPITTSNGVRVQVGINWFDPTRNNAYETTSYLLVTTYKVWINTPGGFWENSSGPFAAC
jgi:hypothetical protein